MKKVAWCSPFSAASSVSEFSHSIIEAHNLKKNLATRAKIDVFANRNGVRYPSSSDVFDIENILANADTLRMFSGAYDDVIYNLGNNKENHGSIYELAKHVPGIAIFHDYVYQHYFAGEIFDRRKSPRVYGYLMGRHYGQAGLRSVAASQVLKKEGSRIGLWDTDLASKYPLLEAIVSEKQHRGIVVHSAMAKNAIEKCYRGPILQLRLPGDEKQTPGEEEVRTWREATVSKQRVTVVIIGHIQRGKQIHYVIETLLNHISQLPKIGRLIIAGKPSDREYTNSLETMIRNRGAGNLIQLETNVSHARLQDIKSEADFYVNIRYPNTEGGSGSLIEQMASNKPVVILNSGIFGEITKGVIRIEDLNNEQELVSALKLLSEDAPKRVSLGDEARNYTNEFLSEDYAEKILEFGDAIREKPIKSAKLNRFETNDVLVYDAEIRSPEPLMLWDIDTAIDFAQLMLSPHFHNDLLSFLKHELLNEPLSAYRAYSVARTIGSLLDEILRGEQPRTWLLSKSPSLTEIFVISTLREPFLRTVVGLLVAQDETLAQRWERANERFTLSGSFGNFAILGALWNIVSSEQATPSAEALRQAASLPTAVLARMLDVTDRDFGGVVVTKWRGVFDSDEYLNVHADLRELLPNSGDNAIRHFEQFGRQEGRKARLKTEALIASLQQ